MWGYNKKFLEIISLKRYAKLPLFLVPFSTRKYIHFKWSCYLLHTLLVLIELNKNCLVHRFFSCYSLVFSEIYEGLWAIWFFVIVEGTQTIDQTDLGSSITFDLTDHVTSDKYLISQSLSLLIFKMEIIFTLQIVVKFSNSIRK